MKNEKLKTRIEALRKRMIEANIAAIVIPSSDPHLSEYTPERWKTREWISGFTGSAGTAVITLNKAGLWTDSRYFLQAEEELKNSCFQLFKTGMPEVPDYIDWIIGELNRDSYVGVDGEVFSSADIHNLLKKLSHKNISLKTDFTPFDDIWENRPAIPNNRAFILSERFSGKSCREKIGELREIMKSMNVEMTVCTALDATAWLFNLRGSDVEYNPVCIAYSIVSLREAVLFIASEKNTEETRKYFEEQGATFDYHKIYDYLKRISSGTNVLITPSKINYKLYMAIPEDCIKTEISTHPVDALKSIKNQTETEGIRSAMKRDGAAMVRFLIWLEKSLEAKEKISELSVAEKLRQLRSAQEYYMGDSFATIAGYAGHGAIVHYEATAASDAEIRSGSLLLVDSGAQYLDGTTDITRTVATGTPSQQMKRDFTLVLKGHIALATARFPKGTVGMQLDILARQFLWHDRLAYFHGTGHGVGHFLNVHEGPQSIRTNYNSTEIQAGMVISCEPGIYRAGMYGIRTENLLLAIEDGHSEFGDFLTFETLTLCPIDKKLIDFSLLTQTEINWINNYNSKIYESLSPLLDKNEQQWLLNYSAAACSFLRF